MSPRIEINVDSVGTYNFNATQGRRRVMRGWETKLGDMCLRGVGQHTTKKPSNSTSKCINFSKYGSYRDIPLLLL